MLSQRYAVTLQKLSPMLSPDLTEMDKGKKSKTASPKSDGKPSLWKKLNNVLWRKKPSDGDGDVGKMSKGVFRRLKKTKKKREMEKALMESREQQQKQQALIKQKDALLKEKDALLKEKDAQLHEYGEIIQECREKEAQKKKMKKAVRETRKEVQKQEDLLKEKDVKLLEYEQIIQECRMKEEQKQAVNSFLLAEIEEMYEQMNGLRKLLKENNVDIIQLDKNVDKVFEQPSSFGTMYSIWNAINTFFCNAKKYIFTQPEDEYSPPTSVNVKF
uniref:golgin subfamily A member 6-like protein 1 isoform X2 n=1 Tax=Myxine glutinosa TaxID=7769 RepID=UPI00358EB4B7